MYRVTNFISSSIYTRLNLQADACRSGVLHDSGLARSVSCTGELGTIWAKLQGQQGDLGTIWAKLQGQQGDLGTIWAKLQGQKGDLAPFGLSCGAGKETWAPFGPSCRASKGTWAPFGPSRRAGKVIYQLGQAAGPARGLWHHLG